MQSLFSFRIVFVQILLKSLVNFSILILREKKTVFLLIFYRNCRVFPLDTMAHMYFYLLLHLIHSNYPMQSGVYRVPVCFRDWSCFMFTWLDTKQKQFIFFAFLNNFSCCLLTLGKNSFSPLAHVSEQLLHIQTVGNDQQKKLYRRNREALLWKRRRALAQNFNSKKNNEIRGIARIYGNEVKDRRVNIKQERKLCFSFGNTALSLFLVKDLWSALLKLQMLLPNQKSIPIPN